jgi:O-antigen/teichoic acid export membrane protein
MNFLSSTLTRIFNGNSATTAAVQTLLTRLLIIVINIVTSVVTARCLGPEGRGEQAAIVLWSQFFAYILTLGIPTALIYQIKKLPDKRSEVFSAALLISLVTGCIAAGVGWVFIPNWLSKYSLEVIQYAQWMMFFAPISSIMLTAVSGMEAVEQFSQANQVRYIPPLSTLLILVILAVTKTITPFYAALAYSLPSLLSFGVIFKVCKREFQWRFRGLMNYGKLLLSYGLRSYGIDLLGNLAAQMDQILVIGMLPPAAMGIYTVALSFSRMINTIHSSVVTVLFPKTSAQPLAMVIQMTGQAARISTFVASIAALAMGLLGEVIFHLFYGEKFLVAIPVFRLLLVEIVISGLTWILAQTFMAIGRPEIPTLLQGFGLASSLPLMLILVPRFSLMGAGMGLLLSSSIRLGFILICYPLVLKTPPPRLTLDRQDIASLIKTFRLAASV